MTQFIFNSREKTKEACTYRDFKIIERLSISYEDKNTDTDYYINRLFDGNWPWSKPYYEDELCVNSITIKHFIDKIENNG